MAVIELSKIKSPEELERVAKKDLEGKSLQEIAEWIADSDGTSRVLSKSGVGYLIEDGYFGIKRNSNKEPDIPELGVEIKTSPLKIGKDGKLRVKEPLSLNIINYVEEAKNKNLKESSLYKKNRKILFVWYVDDKGLRSEYKIKYVFLWEMSDDVLQELEPDYQAILDMVRQGKAHEIHQHQHKFLTLCPKHNGKFKDPEERTSKTPQPFSELPAEVRAFRLKNSYMNAVIRRHLNEYESELPDEFIKEKTPRTIVKKLKRLEKLSPEEINVRNL
ncbi:hypothetical protein K2Q08_00365 [Patescibacteria group bacterium]|nr:hypothetical protein [Patescibacteria group bacterium]